MKREEGYYWVMTSPNSDWVVLWWSGSFWYDGANRYQGNLENITTERIKNPYENF